MNRRIVEGDAELMLDTGIFMNTIAGLITDDLCEQAGGEGRSFLSPYLLEGLMRGLKLAGNNLCDRSETLTVLVEDDEKAQAARERRQGQNKADQSNVGAKCGTQHAA